MTLLDLMFTDHYLSIMPDSIYYLLPVVVLFGSLFIFLMIGMPIAFSIGLSSLLTIFLNFPIDKSASLASQQLLRGLDNFGLLALPFFIFAGNLMNSGGIAKRLINFAMLLGGRLPGALCHVNVIANMMFGSLSGSATASAAAVGGLMGELQNEKKYPKDFSSAVNIASCPSGLLIPPSNVLILYALVSGTSVQYLFLAGYFPGILMGLAVMAGVFLFGKKYNVPQETVKLDKPAFKVIIEAIPSLFMVVLIMSGIVGGVFTATEASAIAVVYSLVLGFIYKELKLKNLTPIVIDSVIITSIVLLMIATSSSMSWAMSNADIPQYIAEFILNISDNPIIILISMNLIFLVVGTFMDMSPAILIFTPILLPIGVYLGMDPIHFGIMMVFNLSIGICTPPVGTALFVGCSIANRKIGDVVPKLLPIYGLIILALIIVTAFPNLTMWLPKLAGY
ncbi:putative transporter [Vibrio ezurae NBRC 102218]|uniref:TRAP transporter large permease protein n=2 Tax=Vibrio ezurae TaxID=252583 RepID=U3B357_9VIBR|nr:putative transporter [Vibrio ezurae NBRC 102218]